MKKLLAIDMEPFVTDEYLLTLAENYGKGKRINEIMKAGLEGKMKFAEGLRLRINELKGLVDENVAKAIAENLMRNIKPEVREIFATAKQLGYVTAIVTGGFDLVADKVKTMLGIDYVYSNKLVFNDGKLYDVIINVDDNKGWLVRELKNEVGIEKKDTIVVLDGWFDLGMAKEGYSIAFRPANGVERFVDSVIKDRTELLDIIKKPEIYFKKTALFVPGPVALTEEINLGQTRVMINHRGNEYRELHKEIVQKMHKIFDCDDVFILTASGAGAVEAMVANMISSDDKLLTFTNGVFGKRLTETAKIYCNNVIECKFDQGKGINLDRVKDIIDANKPDAIAIVHNETSTGVVNDIKDICRYAKSKGICVMVDAISALAGHPLNMKDWGIDICVAGSQKCIGAPPGLAFVGIMNSAMEKIEKNNIKSYYFNLKEYKKFQSKNETPFTPAVSLLFALKVALDLLLQEGLEKRIERHRKAGEILRRKLIECNFELFAENGFESNTVTTFKTNEAEFIKKQLKEKFNIEIAGGMEETKGKILRMGHLGNFTLEQIDELATAIGNVTGGIK